MVWVAARFVWHFAVQSHLGRINATLQDARRHELAMVDVLRFRAVAGAAFLLPAALPGRLPPLVGCVAFVAVMIWAILTLVTVEESRRLSAAAALRRAAAPR